MTISTLPLRVPNARLYIAMLIGLGCFMNCSCLQKPKPEDASKAYESVDSQGSQPVASGTLAEDYITFEFAVYYLPVPSEEPLPVLDSLLGKDFKQVQRIEKIDDSCKDICLSAKVLTNVQEAYRPPDIQYLQYSGRGLSKAQAETLQNCEQALVLDYGFPKEQLFEGLKAANAITYSVAKQTGGVIWDEETRETFSCEAWIAKRLNTWTEEIPVILNHTVIHSYKKQDGVRAITLGMSKFGLPDVVVDGFSWSDNRSIGNIINIFVQSLVEGAKVEDGSKMDLDIRAIKNADFRTKMVETLKKNATGIAFLSLQKGVWEEGDPDNRLIEIAFDRYSGPDVHAKQTQMVSNIFGWEDTIDYVKHNQEIKEASRRAREKLPAIHNAFNAGLAPGEYILVKAPFQKTDGGNEWMWVEVIEWSGGHIKGLLKNEPFHIQDLHAGQIVEVSEDDVFDYIRQYPDGRTEGDETSKPILKATGKDR